MVERQGTQGCAEGDQVSDEEFMYWEFEDHIIGDEKCRACWFKENGPCERPGCPGRLHRAFGDENYEGDYWLVYKCDKCGESE